MGYSAADTAKKHRRILDESIRLFQERGFSDVSVNDVMKAAGLTHGPFYNHFESKDALIAETLTRELRKSIDELDEFPPTKEGKAKFTGNYLSETHRDNCREGCVFATLAPEIRKEKKQTRPPFTELLKSYFQKLSTRFPWSTKASARGDAILTLSAMIGAMVLARAVDDDGFSKEILTEVRKRVG